MSAKQITIGDHVAVKRAALATLPSMSEARGVVTAIEGGWLATVQWRGGRVSQINIGNLCGTRSIAFVEDVRS
jgi:hypothetical protein